MPMTKFIPDKLILQNLNKMAIERGYNQVINPGAYDKIPEASYPITLSFLHSDTIVRCRVVLNKHGDTVLLDIDTDIFNALPEYDTLS